MDGKVWPQSKIQNHGKLGNGESGRNGLQRRAHQPVIWFASPGNMHVSNIIETEQVIMRTHTHTHTHTYILTMQKEAMNLKVSKAGYMGGFVGRKGEGEMM